MKAAWLSIGAILAWACNSPKPEAAALVAPSSSSAVPPLKIEVVRVISQPLDTVAHLQGELSAYESVALFARTSGFVSKVLVDRGSEVKRGQVLVMLVAPELRAQRAEVQAKLTVDESTFQRLRAAAQTPGAVAKQELDIAEAALRADRARLDSLRSVEQYLTVTAPFDGVITERNVHPGALAGPQGAGSAGPMLRMEQIDRLRLTVPVPEDLLGAVAQGISATFSVRAYPGQEFSGTIQRIAHSVDVSTRSMSVELDVDNKAKQLAPGMFADVSWPIRRAKPSLFVPSSAIVQSTEKTFVVTVTDGVVEQVPVQRGVREKDLVEVFGALHEGDAVAKRGGEELRSGMRVETRQTAPAPPSAH